MREAIFIFLKGRNFLLFFLFKRGEMRSSFAAENIFAFKDGLRMCFTLCRGFLKFGEPYFVF